MSRMLALVSTEHSVLPDELLAERLRDVVALGASVA
eukprot:CAMPEP_0195041268 /NCGR_PEP_ID=MMETSP0347-20130606/367_1 /TAXON_ID=2932 /ORGANISM="Alexandrium fundyense, Strain CCMP1719" /LENGTH=35 /DNA_ID= /DNA_START= /DNA_END= /DNA_ORIENTATION=